MTTFLFAQNVGDIVITEIMIDPRGSQEQDREWFEVYNVTNAAIDINGWTIIDNSASGRNHIISSANPVLVPALSYAVLAYNADPTVTVPLQNVIYVYGAPTGSLSDGRPTWNNESTYSNTTNINNTPDGPGLRTPGGLLIDEIKYGFGYRALPAWPAQGTPEAVSYQLNANALNAASNDAAANWAASTNIFGAVGSNNYFGTPGTSNFGFNSGVLNPGAILIIEIMIDPDGTEANTEYFELYNTTNAAIDVQGWALEDVSSSSRTHTIATSVVIAANSYALFATNGDATENGGLTNIAYVYGNPTGNGFPRFNNESSFSTAGDTDGLVLRTNTGLEMDAVRYDYEFSGINFPSKNADSGASWELGLSYYSSTENDLGRSWAQAVNSYGNDLGTPGTANLFDRVYTYDNGWLDGSPDGITNTLADINVTNGSATLNSATIVRSVNNSPGAILNVSGNLDVNGFLTIKGTLNHTGPQLLFSGSEEQVINGTAAVMPSPVFGTVNVSNLVVDNAQDVINNINVNILNTLTIIDGTFENDNNVTLKSTGTNTAIVNALPSSNSLYGDFTVERFIPATTSNPESRAFRFIASPVTSTGSIFDNWQAGGTFTPNLGTHITGAVGTVGNVNGATGFDETGSGSKSLFIFSNDATQLWSSVNSTNQSGDILAPIQGYRLFVRGDRNPTRLAGNVNGNNTTLSATGTLATGNTEQTYAIGASQFILAGNPYQAPVNMELALANSSDINNNIVYYWDPNLGGLTGRGAYTTVSGFAGGGTATTTPASANTKFIQPGQAAFFVTTAGASSAVLRFRESDKGTNADLAATTVFSTPSNAGNQITVTLYDTPSFNAGSTPSDAATLRVDASYSSNVDANDINKLNNLYESLSFKTSTGNNFTILSENNITNGAVYPLDFTNKTAANYTFAIDVSDFVGHNVFLNDNATNTRTALTNGTLNPVNVTIASGDTTSVAADRFAIVFETTTLSAGDAFAANAVVYPNPVSGEEFFIELPNQEQTAITVYNSLGQLVHNSQTTRARNAISTINWNSGIYFVKLNSATKQQTIKLIVK
jgi:hypothetical protein